MSNKGAPQKPEEVPVQGSAYQGDPAIEILLARFSQMESTLSLMNQSLSALRTDTDKQLKAFHQELAENKRTAAEAFQAAREELQRLQEQQPKDPEVLKQMVQIEAKKAKSRARAKREKFKEHLRDCPRGILSNPSAEPLRLGINGIYVIIPPGESKEVPAPFIDLHERLQERRRTARIQDEMIQVKGEQVMPFGELQQWRTDTVPSPAIDDAFGLVDFTPRVEKDDIMLWDESSGVVK